VNKNPDRHRFYQTLPESLLSKVLSNKNCYEPFIGKREL
jgi:hypothetical protein